MDQNFYRSRYLSLGWKTGLWFLIIFSIPRFLIVLQANATGNYQWVSIVFITMMLTPYLILNRQGRIRIGLRKPKSWSALFATIVLGSASGMIIFLVAQVLYGGGEGNWFAYIARSYNNLPSPLSPDDRMLYFLIYSSVSMTFSPIGEEIFYRGLVHENFAKSLGEPKASLVDSLAFSLVHLAHFGVIYTTEGWKFLIIPGLLWVGLLFFTCLLFSLARKITGSLLGAILSHASFNLAMNYFIFYFLL